MTAEPSPTATALVALMKLKGVGRRAALRLVSDLGQGTDRSVYRETVISKARQARMPASELMSAWAKSEEQLEQGSAAGIQTFSFHDDEYPERLRRISDPPAVLFVKGDVNSLHAAKSIAVVGTREPTPYGAKVARKSARTATEAGFVIVSGLALGCDTYAHEGCLEGHGIGIAVLAHGLDRVYPASNRDLAERLLESGGCLVSEYPIEMRPARAAFAERDRIQSGLSDGVLVIETDVKGGTMHTVRFSREQRRPLACIDHPESWLGEEKTKGNQKLIEDGWATPIPDGNTLERFLDQISRDRSEEPDSRLDLEPEERQRSWNF